jgi:hypothetical protein
VGNPIKKQINITLNVMMGLRWKTLIIMRKTSENIISPKAKAVIAPPSEISWLRNNLLPIENATNEKKKTPPKAPVKS